MLRVFMVESTLDLKECLSRGLGRGNGEDGVLVGEGAGWQAVTSDLGTRVLATADV